MSSGPFPLMLTVEHEDGRWSEDYGFQPPGGYAVIKLGGHVVTKIELRYSSDDDREVLEQYAADWLAGLGQDHAEPHR